MRGLVVCCVLGGCGRIQFDARIDAGAIDTSLDAPVDAAGPFGAPIPIAELSSTAEESDPTLTPDGLEIHFTSRRLGTRDIFRATRDSVGDAWGTPAVVTELSMGTSEDDTARIRSDGLVMYFGSDRAGSYDIYMTTRASRGAPWNAPALVTELSSPLLDLSAALSSSELEIYWHSDRVGSAARDIYRATRTDPASAFSSAAIAAVSELNTAANDRSPLLVGDLVMWFDSDRPGGKGLRDLYTTERATTSSAFGPPVPVTELNSTNNDLDPWVSADGSWIVFASGRSGNQEIYEARR